MDIIKKDQDGGVLGLIVKTPNVKPSPAILAENQEFMAEIFAKLGNDHVGAHKQLLEHYAELTSTKFSELVSLLKDWSMDNDYVLNRIWNGIHDGDCPIIGQAELTQNMCVTILNMLAVAYAMSQLQHEHQLEHAN